MNTCLVLRGKYGKMSEEIDRESRQPHVMLEASARGLTTYVIGGREMAINDSTPKTIPIQLTKGYVAIVDEQDADLLNIRWHVVVRDYGVCYAYNHGTKAMHRVILERTLGRKLKNGEQVDHRDNDGLNNTRANLRLATPAQNTQNRRKQRNSPTQYKGVYRNPGNNKNPWKTSIGVNGKYIYLGVYPTPEEAHEVYCKAVIKYHGEFANLKDGSES